MSCAFGFVSGNVVVTFKQLYHQGDCLLLEVVKVGDVYGQPFVDPEQVIRAHAEYLSQSYHVGQRGRICAGFPCVDRTFSHTKPFSKLNLTHSGMDSQALDFVIKSVNHLNHPILLYQK